MVSIMTSGNSKNILGVLELIEKMGVLTFGFVGESGRNASNVVLVLKYLYSLCPESSIICGVYYIPLYHCFGKFCVNRNN